MKLKNTMKAALIAATALAWMVPVQSSALPLTMGSKAIAPATVSGQSDVIKVGNRHRHHGRHHNRHRDRDYRHYRRHRDRDIAAGFVGGAIVGGAIANSYNNNRYYDNGAYSDGYYTDNVWARRRTASSYARRCGCNVYSGDMDVNFYGRGTPGYHRHRRGGYYMHTHSGYLHGHYYQNRH